jgi:taurine dioxygenase
MEVDRIAAPLGARVTGIDVRTLDDDAWRDIHKLFLKYHVLAFPGQELTPQDQMNFASRWGTLVRHPYAAMADYPDVIELKNQGKKQDVNQHWHSDMTYSPVPPRLTMLYALEAPEIGGDTAFSNQFNAFEELSDGIRTVLSELNAEHSAAGLAAIYQADASEALQAIHPVARTHDEINRQALYVCRAFTRKFVGWSRAESKPLLEFLYEHSIRPEYQGRHRWQQGDLVMWDNRCVLHYAVHDHGDDSRVIHRVQVAG